MTDVNAVYEQLNREVRASFADALAATEFQPQFGPIIEEFDVDDTLFDYEFLIDNSGFQKLKKNLPQKGVIKKRVTMYTEEWGDELAVPTRKLTSRHGDSYVKQARMVGSGVGRFVDGQASKLLKSTGKAFTENSWDGVPFFSGSHPMNIANELTGTKSNLDSGGGGDYWYLFDTRFLKPIMCNWKQRARVDAFGPESEWARDNYQVKWKAYMDCGFGLGLWHYAYASNQTLNSDNFRDAREAMETVGRYVKNEDEDDNLLGVTPTLLVVGRSNRGAAEELLDASQLASGASNVLYKAIRWIPLTYLP